MLVYYYSLSCFALLSSIRYCTSRHLYSFFCWGNSCVRSSLDSYELLRWRYVPLPCLVTVFVRLSGNVAFVIDVKVVPLSESPLLRNFALLAFVCIVAFVLTSVLTVSCVPCSRRHQHLIERSWYAVMETCLAFTVFRDDFSPRFVALFTLLLFLKCFHWLAEDRVDFVSGWAGLWVWPSRGGGGWMGICIRWGPQF